MAARSDVADLATEIGSLVAVGRLDDATARLSIEWPYPLTAELLGTVGADNPELSMTEPLECLVRE